MTIIIIAGGSGTRLWPLSKPDYPKHLLNLAGNGTLLQQTFERAKATASDVFIVTEKSHAHHIEKQLKGFPSANILIEPGRRGTANCVLFALDALKRLNREDEAVVFIHCDHIVQNTAGFSASIKKACAASLEKQKIVLCGVKPAYNSVGFGYIEKGAADGDAYQVNAFKEKPDAATAKQYVESGNFLWNTGYFIGSVRLFLREIKKYAPQMQANFEKLDAISNINSDEYNKCYLSLKSGAIDYLLMERDPELLVTLAEFDWADVGNFKDLHDILPKDSKGNYIKGNDVHTIDCADIFVRNDEEKPVAVIGLEHIVVINTPNGILVSSKDAVHKAGEIAKQLQESSR
ncbi:MAG: NTP transferase domain-containing protein [Spirochaetaceae bacterium]|jgi:mannose-1-phosphate guanylyltransferase/mannose-6-phosphate isomerase|nr:NTP transferase domain-containing protein [Spirochaetaceae bacterium]